MWAPCGQRSFILALIAVFLACFRSYADYLGPGERATILVLATDRKQARVIMRYVRGLITGTPLLAAILKGEPRAEGLDLTNGVTIEVATASYRATRGYTIVAALCDELAFWPTDDLAEPDYEILDAIRPGTATIPTPCCCVRVAHTHGVAHSGMPTGGHSVRTIPMCSFGRPQPDSMNPTVPQAIIDRAYDRDAADAGAEYGAEFRGDVTSYITREAIEAVVSPKYPGGPPPRVAV